MKRRSILFLAIAIVSAAALIVAWMVTLLNSGNSPTVPAGQTKTVGGVAWHLDWIKQVDADDPMVTNSYLIVIDGAAFVVAQITYESSAETTACGALIVGADRQWVASNVPPASGETSDWCHPVTAGTFQVVANIPPLAVNEIRGVDVQFDGKSVLLLGHVE